MTTLATIDIQRDGVFVEQRSLTDELFSIGRAEDSDLIFPDPTVSRDHARIEFDDDHHVLFDDTGRQRTLVNDKPIERHQLQSGDQIRIGPYILVYRLKTAVSPRTDMARTETLLAFSPVGLPLLDVLTQKAAHGQLNADEQELWKLGDALRACDSNVGASKLILRQALDLIPADRGQVVFPSEGEALIVAAAMPDDDESREPLSESVIRQVLATGQALACLDVSQDRRFRASVSLAGRAASSVVAVPLVVAGRVAGALCLLREDDASRFVAADLERLCAIAQLAGKSLDVRLTQPPRTAAGHQRRQADLPYPLVYRSQVMHNVAQQVLRVAATDTTVLITGPSGTGKELIAAAMHYGSLRSSGPFVKVNCAAIPETLIESELFGHEKGAFTDAKAERKGRFEQADNGTLFLDEIGDMPIGIQTRLLRALETRQIERVGGSAPINVRVRLIAATHHHLPTRVKQGKFREDLWYRLDVVRIDLPPLKDRLEDVPLLFKVFAESFAANMQVSAVRLGDDAIRWLSDYDWPGNVRQLRNLAERLTVFHAGEQVTAAVVEARLGKPDVSSDEPPQQERSSPSPASQHPGPLKPLAEARADFEKAYIRRALAETGGNITRAAEILGMARENLSRRIRQLSIEP